MNFSIVCNNSGGQIFSLTVWLTFSCESPLLLKDTSIPPNPLFIILVVVIVPVPNFDPNKLLLPNNDAIN